MTYEWRSHTAEVELHVEAPSAEQVYADAVEAFGRLVELDDDGEPARHELAVEGRDRGDLLVALLEELIYLADTRSFVPDRVEALTIGSDGLRATLTGRYAALDPIVKAATYHGLAFEPYEGGWRARVVLDV